MDGYLRLGLLIVAAVILFLLLFESRLRKRRYKTNDVSSDTMTMSIRDEPEVVKPASEHNYQFLKKTYSEPSENIFVLSVFAKPNSAFGSYDLLQAIASTGMQFGEKNIFHYYKDEGNERKILFSLASATKPGHFKLDQIGDFSCVGLTLFMDIHGVSEPVSVFNMMLKAAEQLADDLEGVLHAGPNKPWNPQMLAQYQRRLAQFAL